VREKLVLVGNLLREGASVADAAAQLGTSTLAVESGPAALWSFLARRWGRCTQKHQMQFTTTEEHVQLVERAKALLARERPGASLAELHIEAMKLLVASLEKQKFAMTDRPRKRPASRRPGSSTLLSSAVKRLRARAWPIGR
jgi:hypothetical protein